MQLCNCAYDTYDAYCDANDAYYDAYDAYYDAGSNWGSLVSAVDALIWDSQTYLHI